MSVVHPDAPYLRHRFAHVPPPNYAHNWQAQRKLRSSRYPDFSAAWPSSDGARIPT